MWKTYCVLPSYWLLYFTWFKNLSPAPFFLSSTTKSFSSILFFLLISLSWLRFNSAQTKLILKFRLECYSTFLKVGNGQTIIIDPTPWMDNSRILITKSLTPKENEVGKREKIESQQFMHKPLHKRLWPVGWNYLIDFQLVEYFLQNLIILDHIIFCLRIEIHLEPNDNQWRQFYEQCY